ncbi:hypothetical protein FSARC_4815 [Fusarium sarcochroum]|uniref:Protein kinase domain-containing protein n=1 Tax=Fusarium sarcochroum TaxID=1208366 RepID=A0A8H4XA75_9HYPO|nr:hypothetical protein FSARC_4815 [Fusarium sarcochroum]
MEIHSSAERWDFTEEPRFVCTVIIFRRIDDYFWVNSYKRDRDLKAQVYDISEVNKIPESHIFPPFEGGLTKYEGANRSDRFIKQPYLTSYSNSDAIANRVLREARICQTIQEFPHRNVARYYGCCISSRSLIIGLCFECYAETLSERMGRGIKISDECLDQLKEGVLHLHSLGIVHNDLNQDNIMFHTLEDEEPVLIDFDSSAKRGEPLPAKRGPVPDGVFTAEFDNDLTAFERICLDIKFKQQDSLAK